MTAPPTLEQARSLLSNGRTTEGERAYASILEQQPDNAEALNVMALAALRGGSPTRAVELLERAARSDAGDPVTMLHLGLAHQSLQQYPAAIEALRAAVRLRPDFHVARLHLAAALEHGDAADAALVQYARALKDAQRGGRLVDRDSTPPQLRNLVEHAVLTVRNGRRALFAGLFEPIRAQFPGESLARIEHALRIYLGEEVAEYPDPRQKSTFFHVPGLPASPYLDRRLFAGLQELEAQSEQICAELLALLPSTEGRERVFTSDALDRQNLRGYAGTPSWNGYYFYRHGTRRENNCRSCPITAAALERLPLARIRDHAPEVLFSVFSPGTHLLAHRGVTNTRLVAHLPLLVPPDCALQVGGEVHVWRRGEVVVFDDTYEHEAWNRSAETRVVLIFDLWSPYLSIAERAACASLIEHIGDFRVAMEQA